VRRYRANLYLEDRAAPESLHWTLTRSNARQDAKNQNNPELRVSEVPLNGILPEIGLFAEYLDPLRAGPQTSARPKECLNAISTEFTFLVSELSVLL